MAKGYARSTLTGAIHQSVLVWFIAKVMMTVKTVFLMVEHASLMNMVVVDAKLVLKSTYEQVISFT